MIKYFKQLLAVPVNINWTFYLILALSLTGGISTILYVFGIFFFVFLHEHGHIYAANRFGYKTVDITFSALGGAAHIPGINRFTNKENFIVAFAGPAVNIIFILLLTPIFYINLPIELFEFGKLMMRANIMLVLFNLIPAYPLDGGRILKSVLTYFRLGTVKTNKICTYVAKGFAVLFVIGAFMIPAPMLGFIAFMIWFSSEHH